MDKSLYSYIAKNFISSFPPRILPPSIEIDLTNSCNQNCVYCNANQYRKKNRDRANKSDYIALLNSFKYFYSKSYMTPLPTITFVGGGEPTINKDFPAILEHALKNEFQCSIISNGVNIDRIFEIPERYLSNISWIGIDMDSGSRELYNTIRRPNNKNDFSVVCENIRKLVSSGINTDIKVLLCEYNSTLEAIEQIIKLASELHPRMIYFRFAVTNGSLYIPKGEMINFINDRANHYGVNVRINATRSLEKNYQKCYSFFLLPVFAADGNTYLCCENRGKKEFILCDWINESFFDVWLSKKHISIWKNIDAAKCKPCRANIHNIMIQNYINTPDSLEQLFF